MRKEQAQTKKVRNPITAAVLSLLVPGLGQVYCGEIARGVSLLLGISAQVGLFYGARAHWYAIPTLLVWPWVVWDAARAARGGKAPAHLPILLILILNLFAACHVTQIQVPELQPEQRHVMGQISTGLLNPDFFARKTREKSAIAKFVVPGPGAQNIPTEPKSKPGEPSIRLSPLKAQMGTPITIRGIHFPENQIGTLHLVSAEESRLGRFHTNSNGQFVKKFANPRSIPGEYFVQATVDAPTGTWKISRALADASYPMFQTIYLALLGTAFSLILAIPLSFFGARNIMSASPLLKVIYSITRGVFTILRSVEVLIIAVIAAAAVGIGPFAGVIALAIHGVGALGKLYSEAIESIEYGPIEALRSTGANEFQVVLFAVVPQVVPQFIAFTLYRWDINVRTATVIGLVGGGGIGYQLVQAMNLLQWRQAATAIWLIAGVVMLMDYASAVIREKIV